MSCWLANNQLSWNALLFSCSQIGQLCLGGPSYSSRTVSHHYVLDTLIGFIFGILWRKVKSKIAGNNCLLIVDQWCCSHCMFFVKIKRCFLLSIMLMKDEPLLSGQALWGHHLLIPWGWPFNRCLTLLLYTCTAMNACTLQSCSYSIRRFCI